MEQFFKFNKYQSTIEDLNLESYPKEVQEQFWDFLNNVPYINYMVKERPRAKDLPRDSKGRIIVDITKPHILENMDYFRPSSLAYKQYGKCTISRPILYRRHLHWFIFVLSSSSPSLQSRS